MDPEDIAGKSLLPRQNGNGLPEYFEPRCHVCTHQNRHAIERLIALGSSHSSLGRQFDIDRRSITRHAENHLSYEQAAIREIIAHEAKQINADYEEGVKGALMYRSYLSAGLKKAWDDMIEGNVRVDPSVAIQFIQQMDKFDREAKSVGLEQLQSDFMCFQEAVKSILPREQWPDLAAKYDEILSQREAAALLDAPS